MKRLILVLSLLICIFSCKKEEENTPRPVVNPSDSVAIDDSIVIDTPEQGYFKVRFVDQHGNRLPNEGIMVFRKLEDYQLNMNPIFSDSTRKNGSFRFYGHRFTLKYFFRPIDPSLYSLNQIPHFEFSTQGDSINNEVVLEKRPFLKRVVRKDQFGSEKVLIEIMDLSHNPQFRINESVPLRFDFSTFHMLLSEVHSYVTGIGKLFFVSIEINSRDEYSSIHCFDIGPYGPEYGMPNWRFKLFPNGGGFQYLSHYFNYPPMNISYGAPDILLRHFQSESLGNIVKEWFRLRIDSECNIEYYSSRTFDDHHNPFLLLDLKILALVNVHFLGCEMKKIPLKDFWINTPFNMGEHNLLREEDSLTNKVTTGTHTYNSLGYPEESHYTIDSAGVTIEDYTLYFEYEL